MNLSSLTPQQVRHFHTRGFLVLERALPQALLDSICRECERILQAHKLKLGVEKGVGCILGIVPRVRPCPLSKSELAAFFVRISPPRLSAHPTEPLGRVVTTEPLHADELTTSDAYLSVRSKWHDPRIGEGFLFGSSLRTMLVQLMGEDLYLVTQRFLCVALGTAFSLLAQHWFSSFLFR